MSISEELQAKIRPIIRGQWDHWHANTTPEQQELALREGEEMKDPEKSGPIMA